MSRLLLSQLLRYWHRRRRRWPLTRQIAIIFAALMITNGTLVSTALDYWGSYRVKSALAMASPQAQVLAQRLEKGNYLPTKTEMIIVKNEILPLQQQLANDINDALYALIALAGLVTLCIGYLILGRLGKGLTSVATAARHIADGDLTARATHVGFASREESQLIRDFNKMSASLQRAERELAESTASIAHELRTPLTILRGRLHGIADGVFALEPREVRGLLYQVEGLGRLVDDLQTLSLANSHRLILTEEPSDLADEVRKVLAAMQPDLIAAGLNPVLALQPTPLIADSTRVRQVISAVLANVCRYAAHSGDLRITTRSDTPFAILEVLDCGPGLPDGAEGIAFDRFWRGEASRSRNTGGSGLGLSVVRAIVEAHGGTATLTNHPRGGALFEMRLPRTNM